MTDNNHSDIQTIIKNIGSAQRIAVILPQEANVDLLAAAVALSSTVINQSFNTQSQEGGFVSDLEAGQKIAMIFTSAGQSMPQLTFLKSLPAIHSTLNSGSQLAIKISNRNAQPKELRYEKNDDGLTVFITPGDGEFQDTDVSVLPGAADFDLAIILGAQNLEQLGTIYTENTKLFFETPTINIDVNPTNEFYGTINFVQTTASSISEVVMDIIETSPDVLTDENVSTALLAGIISQTSSFRDPKTTPQVLLKASRLVSAGAKQQDIIQHLFKTKPLPLLQLWGRALARVTSLAEKQLLTAILTKSDFEKTSTGAESLAVVVRDIIEMITGYSLVILLAELPKGTVDVVIAGLPFEDLLKVATQFISHSPTLERKQLFGKYEYVSISLNIDLPEAQLRLNKIIESRNSVV